MKRFNHPHIAKFYDDFEDSNKFYIVMEYFDGEGLFSFLQHKKSQNRPLPENFIIKILSQLSSALNHIHGQKIIHRDLKGSNILLTLENDAIIIDFGLSKLIESTLRGASTFAGTKFYMSPEMLSRQGYSYPTDIWSLGILLYQMMTFDFPFKEDMLEFAEFIKLGNLPPITKDYSSELKQLVSDMVNIDPLKRISASQILKMSFIQSITSDTSSSQIESSSPMKEINTPEENFNFAKKCLSENKFEEAEDFLILSIKEGLIEAVNEYVKCVKEGKFKSLKKFELEKYFLISIEKLMSMI
jgi:NIMA (never in mitosis gene a)-related kinase